MAYTEEEAFNLIQSAFEKQRLGHAFLIIGEEEAGTHRLASKMVDLVNGEPEQEAGLDLFGDATVQVNGEPKPIDELEGELVRVLRPEKRSRIISVQAMRQFEKSLYSVSPKGKWNIGIIEPADRMNDQSANAFLKTLEEPPKQTLLILITQQPERLLPTILSRCINMHLVHTGPRTVSESESKLLQSIAGFCKNGFESDVSALKMKSIFAGVLAERKATISKANEQALKDEEALYAKSTDGNWLKDRQEFYKAQTESEYLLERTLLMDTLISWFGDIVRQKSKFNYVEYTQIETLTKKLAQTEEVDSLILRMEALESLRDSLNTNADEKLALEVGFIKAFG